MSLPKEDADSDSSWGMTASQAWRDFAFNLVDRYDGDGIDDAPGITCPALRYLHLGNEPDAPEHFADCGGLNTDLDCYAKVHLEIKDGVDRTPLLNIARPNSIENRLIKLLIYLRSRFPDDGWAQFLASDSTINWPAIIVSGHSQGGGHAAIIGRYHPVARVVMFAAMDYNSHEAKPANWIAVPSSTPNATPAELFFGFSHQRDELVDFTLLSTQIWPAFGMDAFGPVTNVDATAPPYQNTHMLTSNLDTPTDRYHGCVAEDRNLALLLDGTPVYKPVWEYLLSNTVVSVKEKEATSPEDFLSKTIQTHSIPLPRFAFHCRGASASH